MRHRRKNVEAVHVHALHVVVRVLVANHVAAVVEGLIPALGLAPGPVLDRTVAGDRDHILVTGAIMPNVTAEETAIRIRTIITEVDVTRNGVDSRIVVVDGTTTTTTTIVEVTTTGHIIIGPTTTTTITKVI